VAVPAGDCDGAANGNAIVAVYSDADKDAPDVDGGRGRAIGPLPVAESHLVIETLSRLQGEEAEAVHPAMGFCRRRRSRAH
jgi:acetyl/propionyl-CoA carboxylase alpha subunit